jgi:hypothetical protein
MQDRYLFKSGCSIYVFMHPKINGLFLLNLDAKSCKLSDDSTMVYLVLQSRSYWC